MDNCTLNIYSSLFRFNGSNTLKKLNLDKLVKDILDESGCEETLYTSYPKVIQIVKQALIDQEERTRRACGDAVIDSLAYQNNSVNKDNIHGIMGYKICVGVSTIE